MTYANMEAEFRHGDGNGWAVSRQRARAVETVRCTYQPLSDAAPYVHPLFEPLAHFPFEHEESFRERLFHDRRAVGRRIPC